MGAFRHLARTFGLAIALVGMLILVSVTTVAVLYALSGSALAADFSVSGNADADMPWDAVVVDWYVDATPAGGGDIPYEPSGGNLVDGIGESGSPVTYDGATLGDEIAWLAVQMAGVASDYPGVEGDSLYAPNANPWTKIDDPRLAKEFAIMDLEEEICPQLNCAYASCNQAACAVLAAVVDMDMLPHDEASGGPANMLAYLSTHPETWMRVDASSTDDLRPGDVLVHTGHTAIYVGNEAARQRFPETSACVYQAGYREGIHARYPQLDEGGYDRGYSVFRAIRRNTESEYPMIDYRAIIAETHAALE